jgi:hypothetical protein
LFVEINFLALAFGIVVPPLTFFGISIMANFIGTGLLALLGLFVTAVLLSCFDLLPGLSSCSGGPPLDAVDYN